MLRDSSTETGWEVIVDTEGVAPLLGACDDLDPDATYTRSDLAEATAVPLKTLYLDDAVDECVDLGVLERVADDDAGEARYRVDPDSEVLAAAAAFDDAVRDARCR